MESVPLMKNVSYCLEHNRTNITILQPPVINTSCFNCRVRVTLPSNVKAVWPKSMFWTRKVLGDLRWSKASVEKNGTGFWNVFHIQWGSRLLECSWDREVALGRPPMEPRCWPALGSLHLCAERPALCWPSLWPGGDSPHQSQPQPLQPSSGKIQRISPNTFSFFFQSC